MDEFLSELGGGAGERGEFTLDGRRSVERFKTFQEADPAYFFLRLVQVLNRQGASRIEVTWTPDTVEITPVGCLLPEAESLEGLNSTSALRDPDDFAFLVAFSCAEVAGHLGFSWTPDRVWLKSPLLPLVIIEAAEQRCCFSPALISLNGESIERDWPPVLNAEGEKSVSGFFVEWYQVGDGLYFEAPDLKRYKATKGFYTWNPRSRVIPRAREWYLHSFALGGEPHRGKFSAVYSIPRIWTGDSQLLIVKDGVCLAPLKIVNLNAGLKAVVSAPEVATDLSGLAAIEDETVKGIRQFAAQRLSKLISFLLEHHKDLPVAMSQASSFRVSRKDNVFGRMLRAGAAQSSRFALERLSSTVTSWVRELQEVRGELEGSLE